MNQNSAQQCDHVKTNLEIKGNSSDMVSYHFISFEITSGIWIEACWMLYIYYLTRNYVWRRYSKKLTIHHEHESLKIESKLKKALTEGKHAFAVCCLLHAVNRFMHPLDLSGIPAKGGMYANEPSDRTCALHDKKQDPRKLCVISINISLYSINIWLFHFANMPIR